jgi:enoyl-CoA hydratase
MLGCVGDGSACIERGKARRDPLFGDRAIHAKDRARVGQHHATNSVWMPDRRVQRMHTTEGQANEIHLIDTELIQQGNQSIGDGRVRQRRDEVGIAVARHIPGNTTMRVAEAAQLRAPCTTSATQPMKEDNRRTSTGFSPCNGPTDMVHMVIANRVTLRWVRRDSVSVHANDCRWDAAAWLGGRKSLWRVVPGSAERIKIQSMTVPSFDNLLYAIDERICTITLNRPDKLNAMSRSLLDELEVAFSAAKADASVSVVLLKGAGRAFCAGYDLAPDDWILSQYGADFEGPVDAVIDRDDVTEILERWLRLWKFPKPIIAQVQGACLSGAGELLGVADIVVAGEGAKFGHPAGRDLGIPVTLSFWPMLIGMRKTKELLFTSRLISGTEAERIGLVNQVVPDADLEDAALEMARDVARTADVGLRMSKLATNRWFENMGLMASCYSTADLDTFFHQSSTYVDFFSAVRERGMATALQERAEKFS